MLLWHLGLGAGLIYVTLGRRRIDYRYILAGAIAPDLIDGLLGLVVFEGPAGRWLAHSLLAVVLVGVVTVLLMKGERRLAVIGLAVGWLTHLVADGMWEAPRTFLWPAFGTSFADSPAEPYSWDLFLHPLAHLSTWGGELVGAGLLLYLAAAYGLFEPARLRSFLADGHLKP